MIAQRHMKLLASLFFFPPNKPAMLFIRSVKSEATAGKGPKVEVFKGNKDI